MTSDPVMLVEDDRDLARTVAAALESEGYRVQLAANGAEALARLEAGERPSVILLDMMMPVMDGWEFRRRQCAREDLAAIPVVVMSADGSAARHAASFAAAASLSKPLDIDQLFETVARVARGPQRGPEL